MKTWQIWIDTGGTFTDGMAIGPTGETVRIKVLSSSCLRGVLVEKIAPGVYAFEQKWHCDADIFSGYTFRLLSGGHATATVSKTVLTPPTGNPYIAFIHLNRDISAELPARFEISAGEEAPVLAARIATRTPLNAPLPPLAMRLGTTKGTNALLEKKGAKVTLFITKGFADLPAIGTQQRPHLFQLDIPPPELLFDRVVEIEERLAADGTVLAPLSEPYIREAVAAAKGSESIAIALLHSYRNASYESRLATALHDAGCQYISASAALSPAVKLLPRTQTALVNAYLEPVLHRYLSGIRTSLGDSALHIMTSAGGLAQAAHYHAKDSLLSGPAGGVVGAARVARSLGVSRILTLDMGGTSTDSARYDNGYDYRFRTRVGHAEMLSPSLDIETVAAGGGSLCYFDGRKLCVGPESAGADPGPACYGAGGPLTITDVNLLLGKLDPSAMGIPISAEKAKEALQRVKQAAADATGIDYSEEELLYGFEQIADERMAGAIRRISVARGFNPGDYALLAFGGAGGLHACRIAARLGMNTVILPYDAGLLSAFGIGHARIERFATRQVLAPLGECNNRLPGWIAELTQQAFAELAAEGIATDKAEVAHRLLHLRFAGQDSSLEIDWNGSADLAQLFQQQYRALYGHYPAGRAIELESIRIVAVGKVEEEAPTFDAPVRYAPVPASWSRPDYAAAIPVFDWDQLEKGAYIPGPAVLLNPRATAFIAAGWELEIRANQNAVIERRAPSGELPAHREAVELELFTNRFSAIAEEMGEQLQRTAFSVNVKERLDFSCAVLDEQAELLVNAPHIPVHLGSLGICARLVLEKLPLGPGDVAITNHPRYGGSHLPDVTLLRAVFSDEGERLGYVINRAHHAEIGGRSPGSMPPDAHTLAEEGVVIPPMYLIKAGLPQWEAMEQLFTQCLYPTRALVENMADLNAALAALQTGEAALKALARTHGSTIVKHYMGALKDMAAQALDEALQNIPSADCRAEERLDDGSLLPVRIRIGQGNMDIDFSGASPVHPGNLNANISIVYSVVLYVLRLLVKKDIPLNEGLLRRVRIVLPEDSLLHPRFEDDGTRCPAVAGGNTELSQRLTDTLLKALGLAACSQGTMNNFLFGNAKFGYYETIGGGSGAGAGFAGRSAVHQHMTNTRITDPEELELRYPVRLLRFAIRRGSGGQGQWPGGDGIIREFEFLEAVEITLLAQHRVVPPYGMAGGLPGLPGAQYLLRSDSSEEPLQGTDNRKLQPGDRLCIETPGGGGWGDFNSPV